VEHRIRDGDTLTRLAQQYLGRKDRYLEIYDFNRNVLTNPDLLPIGVVLKMPPRGAAAASAPTPQWKTSSNTAESWAPATGMVPVERQSAGVTPRIP
jgi:phage tail protein X